MYRTKNKYLSTFMKVNLLGWTPYSMATHHMDIKYGGQNHIHHTQSVYLIVSMAPQNYPNELKKDDRILYISTGDIQLLVQDWEKFETSQGRWRDNRFNNIILYGITDDINGNRLIDKYTTKMLGLIKFSCSYYN